MINGAVTKGSCSVSVVILRLFTVVLWLFTDILHHFILLCFHSTHLCAHFGPSHTLSPSLCTFVPLNLFRLNHLNSHFIQRLWSRAPLNPVPVSRWPIHCVVYINILSNTQTCSWENQKKLLVLFLSVCVVKENSWEFIILLCTLSQIRKLAEIF